MLFGSEVADKPINPKDEARLHQFGAKLLLGIFTGYSLNVGRRWTGDILLLAWDHVEGCESISDIH